MTHSIDWGRPEIYLRGLTTTSRWQRLLLRLDVYLTEQTARSARRREAGRLRALRRASREIPPHLRRDIGLE